MDVEALSLEITAVVGSTEIPMSAYLGLEIGDILLLDRRIGESFTIEVGEVAYFRGRPGLSETRKAVKLDERIHTR